MASKTALSAVLDAIDKEHLWHHLGCAVLTGASTMGCRKTAEAKRISGVVDYDEILKRNVQAYEGVVE